MTWPIVSLADVAEVRLGRQRAPKNHSGDSMRPYIRAANVTWAGLDLSDVKTMNFTDNEMATYRMEPGDIVLGEASGSPGEVGKPALWSGEISDCAFQNTLIRVRAREHDPKFLVHYFRYLALDGQFVEYSRGVGIHHIGRARLASWPTPLPPLDEQHRIVDLLEYHLSRLDAAEAYLDAALRRAEMLRWGSVAEAVSATDGREVRLGDIASVRNGIFVSRPGSEPNGVPILRIGAVRSLSLDLSDLRYSERTEEDLREADGLAQPGDLLFTRYNGNPRFVGACAAVPEDAPVLTYPDKLIRVRVTHDAALSEFVALACSVGAARAEIEASVRTTAGQAGIAGRDLKNVTLTLPDLAAQRAAIRAASESGMATTRLSRELETAQRRCGALRRSLLAAAFSGRLTSAAPHLSAAEEMIGA
jgi:type I restriction enzyme S subunit